ncbi:aldo/keto reductase [Pseudomonas quasicaspiana]|uniref:aldo/keto reductase n=1 Tax=Pseudomonas quasicaspiana TaxID=2829821 RepID=UPI001E2A426B|nr:aldo/keto reductase [Pseudomonas quasicaspiana]MCD5980669.1 aldo/keto reductase [Pseudomonas quasicaspiana]
MDRRDFLTYSAAGAVAAALLPASSIASSLATAPAPSPLTERGSVMRTEGRIVRADLPLNSPSHKMRYMTPQRFGMGGTQIGNIFAPISDEQADSVLQAAWNAGVRLYDTSPFYGFGLSEYRLGRFLRGKNPADYVISTKVGRVLTAAGGVRADHAIWKSPAPFNYRYDYTAAGTRRSVEDSLQRLGLPRIDIVFIHDLSPDNTELEGGWEAAYQVARTGAMVELEKMRAEGLIKAWGFGVNTPNAVVQAMTRDDPTPDIVLLACQYSLLDHRDALSNTFPALKRKGTSVVVGTPLNDGFLGGRSRYNFSPDIPAGAIEKRARIMAVASQHGIDIHTAALQFAAAHPQVSAIIPGARSPGQIIANVQAMKVGIPAAFWEDLKSQSLIDAQAPVPS